MQINQLRQVEINPLFKGRKNYIIYDNFFEGKGKENFLLSSKKKKNTSLFIKNKLVFKNSCLTGNKNLNDIVEIIDYSYLVKKSMLRTILKKFLELKILALKVFKVKALNSFNGLRNLVRVRFNEKYKDGFVVFFLGKSFFSSLLSLSLMKKKLPFKVFFCYLNFKKIFKDLFFFFRNISIILNDLNYFKGPFLKKVFFLINIVIPLFISKVLKYIQIFANISFFKHKFFVFQRYLFFFKVFNFKVRKYIEGLRNGFNFSVFYFFSKNLIKIKNIKKIKFFYFKFFLLNFFLYENYLKKNLKYIQNFKAFHKNNSFLLKYFYFLFSTLGKSVFIEKFFLFCLKFPFLNRNFVKLAKNVYGRATKFLYLEKKLKEKKNLSFHSIWKLRRFNKFNLYKLRLRLLKLGVYNKFLSTVLSLKILTKLFKKYAVFSYKHAFYRNRNRPSFYKYNYRRPFRHNNERNRNYSKRYNNKRNHLFKKDILRYNASIR